MEGGRPSRIRRGFQSGDQTPRPARVGKGGWASTSFRGMSDLPKEGSPKRLGSRLKGRGGGRGSF